MEALNLTLPQYNSSLELSSRIADIFNVFIIPMISIAGFVEKTMSIVVLSKIINKKGKNNSTIYNYMITNEIIDIINCCVIGFTFLFRCGTFCSYGYTFISKIYDMVFFVYFTNTLQQAQTFLEISFSK